MTKIRKDYFNVYFLKCPPIELIFCYLISYLIMKFKIMVDKNRVLGRLVAHEMTAGDIDEVSGARWYGTGWRGSWVIQAGESAPAPVDSSTSDTMWDN